MKYMYVYIASSPGPTQFFNVACWCRGYMYICVITAMKYLYMYMCVLMCYRKSKTRS